MKCTNSSGVARVSSWQGTTGPLTALLEYLTVLLEYINFSLVGHNITSTLAMPLSQTVQLYVMLDFYYLFPVTFEPDPLHLPHTTTVLFYAPNNTGK